MMLRLATVVLASASALAGPLTPAEQRGRHIYLRGESPAGRPIAALVSGAELAATVFACGTCHGPDGRGVAEGSIEPSDIRGSVLRETLLAGRRRPRYDDERLARAIREGADSAGNPLSPVMPRFRMADEDLSDLVSYLKRLGEEPQPGLTESSLAVATAAHARPLVEAYFKDVNAEGGIYGRTLHVTSEEPFAVVCGTPAGPQDERVPLIAPFPSPGPASFSLFPDLETQARILAGHARGGAVYALHDGTPAAVAAASSVSPRATGWSAIADARPADGDLLFLLGAVDVPAALRRAGSLHWKPRVLIAGAALTPEIFESPLQILVAAPSLPADLTEEGLRELHAFSRRHGIPAAQLAAQTTTYAALKVFVEGLKRAGRDLTREKLIASLEQLYQFSTGLTPPVTYARNRHIGSTGAHVLTVDAASRRLVAAR